MSLAYGGGGVKLWQRLCNFRIILGIIHREA
jgi:hypothetical protein